MSNLFMDYLISVSETIFWDHGPSPPWELEAGGPKVPDGSSWFFLVNHPRTGSTAAVAHLNAHPDLYCGDEER